MLELAVTIGMTVGSFLLFGYWFRYTCVLILSTKTVRDYARAVAAANRLGFLEIQERLRGCASANLDQIHAALDRDYGVIVSLMSALSREGDGQASLETGMLQLNYRCMAAWSRFSRRFSMQSSCRALEEMSQIVAYLANLMGEQAASPAAA
ncbi:MAG: hypothetical protein JO307_15705 [Bryobacterales bacterium]|nr:hypothetical protein [Bryobacterales bacterium]MBV9399551.1 hypothetical protein [Bryobacterales bacterium]